MWHVAGKEARKAGGEGWGKTSVAISERVKEKI
jgi:hypothetical protein